ncbi:MAG: hypothetical protein HYX51_05955 [Chloroflexi bacterium]|nr:hypothetical protein [Chloroflexota bacterium]
MSEKTAETTKTTEKTEKSEKVFDASRYLTKLKGKDYLEVKWRLLWLRTEHPDAVIETELARLDMEPPMAVFRARVSIPDGGSATGWGQEELKDFGDFLEKAETKALGRALAALGYGTQFTEDFDFAEGDPNRVVDAPVDRGSTRGGSSNRSWGSNGANGGNDQQSPRMSASTQATVMTLSGGAYAGGRPENRPVLPATEPQIKAIFAIARGAQAMDDAEVEARCKELYGVTPSALSRRQASEFIDALKGGQAN